jgi:tetratricopeptide (TPR) repeat protein
LSVLAYISPLVAASIPFSQEVLVLLLIGILGLFLLLLAALIYLRESQGNRSVHSSASSVALPKLKLDSSMTPADSPQPTGNGSPYEENPGNMDTKKIAPRGNRETAEDDTHTPFSYLSVGREHEAAGRFEPAAEVYKVLGLLADEVRVREKMEPTQRLVELLRSLGKREKELEVTAKLVQNNPMDWQLRVRLIDLYLKTGATEKAVQLFETAQEERVSLKIELRFFLLAGIAFENCNLFSQALICYKNAATAEETNTLLHSRMNYLRSLDRLQSIDESTSHKMRTSEVFRYASKNLFEDSSTNEADLDLDFDGTSSQDESIEEELRNKPGVQIFVGHPSIGKSVKLSDYSHLQVMNPITRMDFETTLSERTSTVLFQCRDRLIDFPVTLRLQRLFIRPTQYGLLATRLRAINSLFHPNITKLIYADCVNDVVRVVTEYHQGGSFYAMIKQLKQIGLPLGLRLLLQIASGMVFSQKHGIIHGDLRAENIMIGHDQLIKIVDFSMQPWPVRPYGMGQGLPLEEVRVDLLQFADLIEFTLGYCNVTSFDDNTDDPKAKVQRLVENIRDNRFDSMAGIQNELIKLLDDVIPQG